MLSLPPEQQVRRKRTISRVSVAGALLTSAIGLGLTLGPQLASADPASGEGPLTVSDNGHWFEYADNGEPYFMAGSGGPEGFLYYSDQRRQEIVDQLIDNDVRAVYIHAVRSNGGDGSNDENPFIGNNPNNGVDPAVLDEWDSYLSQLDDAGIVTWFHLYDDGARPYGACNPDLPAAEKEFVQTIVERFRDYQHLVWLPTEEHIIKACGNNATDVEKAEALAAEIRLHDDVHPLGVHHNNGQTNQYLGNTDIDVFAQQVCQQQRFRSVDGLHDAAEFGEDVYVMAECHSWHKELLDAGERTTLRQSFWSSVMGGGYVLFYDAWESNDPTDEMLADLGRINQFMDTTRFAETEPADQLAAAGTKWVLASESADVYIAYSNDNPSSMGIQGISAGSYELGWFDPLTGTRVDQVVTVSEGTATFPVPSQIGNEVALSIEPTDSTPSTTAPPTTAPPTTAPPTTAPPTTAPPTTAPPTTAPPGTDIELGATQDAYIQGSTAFDNGQLRVETGARNRTSYVQFDTSNIESADDARLQLTVGSDPGNGTIQVWLGEQGDWTEATLTPSNAPTAGDLLGSASGPFTQGQLVDITLPADVIDGDVLDLVITTTGAGGDDVSFTSSEGVDGPKLAVTESNNTPSTTTPPTTTPSTTTPSTTAPPTTTPPTTTPPTTTPATGPARVLASDDAYLQGKQAFDGTQLRVEHGDRTRISYLRFDTSAIDGSATLELTVGSDAGDGTISVSRGVGGNWTEGTLTPGNAPDAGEILASVSGPFTPGQLLKFELPAGTVDGAQLDLVITTDGQGSDDVSFDASETTNGPALVASGSSTTTPPATTPPGTTPPTTPPASDTDTVTFSGTDGAVPNPERGFHEGASVADSDDDNTTSVARMESMYDDGIRLARMYVRLDDYRNGPIPQSQLDALDEVFANARAGGIKLIPRFSYNFGSAPDASVERIEQHIEQLTPTLRANADVIAVLQAGFIGAWGEWHSSTNGLTNEADRARVRNALLDALPDNRMAQFRYPDDLIEFEATPLTAAEAWTGSDASRTGHKNDCFLANEHDAGTYIPLSQKSVFLDYLNTMTEVTPMGGETCQVTLSQQRTDCPTALAELELLHWDYLNLGFYGNTIDKWKNDGCFEEIDARLGYRFEMQQATASTEANPGGALALSIEVENEGFGKLFNPRPINVVLVNEATGATTTVEAVADARRVMPLPGSTVTLDLGVQLPSDIAPGTYVIHVELPDEASSLEDDPRFSIQMANAGTWEADSGTNNLGLEVTVSN